MPGIHITDIEAAINYWRERTPSPDGITLGPELRALAEVYALLVFYHEEEADEASFPAKAMAAWRVWYDTTADTPCIAICSTSQGTPCAKAVAEVLTRCSTGRPCRRVKSAPVGGASRSKEVRGALAVMQTGPWRKSP